MVELSYPGVYIQEVPPLSRAITGASTSTAAFIGLAERGPANTAVYITSFDQFINKFGSFITKDQLGFTSTEEVYLPYAVWAFFQNGGRNCYIVRVSNGAKASKGVPGTDIPEAFGGNAFTIDALGEGQWANHVEITIKDDTESITPNAFDMIVTKNGKDPTITEFFGQLTMDKNGPTYVASVVNEGSNLIHIDKVAPSGKPNATVTATTTNNPLKLGEGNDGSDPSNEQIKAAFKHFESITDVSLIATPGYSDKDLVDHGINYCKLHRNLLGDAFFIADVPKEIGTNTSDDEAAFGFVKNLQHDIQGYGAVYYPWIIASDQVSRSSAKIQLPPSGFIAGLYAQIDNTRGVWKSPAGTEATVAGAIDLPIKLSDQDQGRLNKVGLNAIRQFSGYGILVWGARTVSSDITWRYISVRRMANFLKSSIYDGIQWAVFEPNDEPLWAALRLSIGGFMTDLFRQGALQGSTPQEAFFVKCDNQTTTATDQQNGIVNVLVGFAALKPAEFVVIKLSQIVAPQQQ